MKRNTERYMKLCKAVTNLPHVKLWKFTTTGSTHRWWSPLFFQKKQSRLASIWNFSFVHPKHPVTFLPFVFSNLLPSWFLTDKKQLKPAGLWRHTGGSEASLHHDSVRRGGLKRGLRLRWERSLRMFHLVGTGCKKKKEIKVSRKMWNWNGQDWISSLHCYRSTLH